MVMLCVPPDEHISRSGGDAALRLQLHTSRPEIFWLGGCIWSITASVVSDIRRRLLLSMTRHSFPSFFVQFYRLISADWKIQRQKAAVCTLLLLSSLWICNCSRFILKIDGLTSHSLIIPQSKASLPLFVPGGHKQVQAAFNLMFPQRPSLKRPLHIHITSDFAQPRLELRLAEQA